ncbi:MULTISPECIES: hypothetical protein [unclassified Microbacterium]|uniref:hypothetical protein n=1 Tax=unclassified Microbacterium TaxID=2609290 RepID=UPI003016DEF9
MTDRLNRLILTDKDGDTLRIERATEPDNGAAFLVTSTSGVFLTAEQARQLIDRLEPVAAPPRTALDVFKDFPLGQAFLRNDRSGRDRRVKVSTTHYVTTRQRAGEPTIYEAARFFEGQPENIIEAVTA